jgi:hypothetical protein
VANSTEPGISQLSERGSGSAKDVLHVIVGHGLPTYFLNTVRSMRSVAPNDQILVVDNASPDANLRADLISLASEDPHMRLILRESNDLTNGKVGGLYDAYRESFEIALREQFDFVHLVQGDMQVLWWDQDVLSRAEEIFSSNPRCVNIYTCLFSSDRRFDVGLEEFGPERLRRFVEFGLTDLGLYHLERWKSFGMRFDNDELEHGKRCLKEGFTVICHPWCTDAQIPWPAVVRNGHQQGREVAPVKPFLLRPMTSSEIEEMKGRGSTWLEEVCVPWGWTCLSPMWTTHMNPDYLANRRYLASREGFIKSLPRWDRRGLDNGSWRSFLGSQHRPSLWSLLVVVPWRETASRIKKRLTS